MRYIKNVNNARYSLIFIIFLSNIFAINSMEDLSPIIIEDYHGLCFPISPATAERCSTLKNCLEQKNEIINQEKYLFTKEFDDGFGNVQDFSGIQDISFFDIQATDIPLTKQALTTAFALIEQPRKCNDISKDRLRSIFKVVTFLDPRKEKVIKKLVQKMRILRLDKELNKHDALYEILISDKYKKTIEMLIKEELPHDQVHYLNFSNKNLDSIKGLEHLGTNKNVLSLNLNNNRLTELDIAAIIDQFPKIQSIKAIDNNIETVIFPERLNDITIALSRNNIKKLPPFSIQGHSDIYLIGNPLSKKTLKTIQNKVSPNFIVNIIKSIQNNKKEYVESMTIGFLMGGAFAMGIGVPLTRISYLNDTINLPYTFLITTFGLIVPPLSLLLSSSYYINLVFKKFNGTLLCPEHLRCFNTINKACLVSGLIIGGICCLDRYKDLNPRKKFRIIT